MRRLAVRLLLSLSLASLVLAGCADSGRLRPQPTPAPGATDMSMRQVDPGSLQGDARRWYDDNARKRGTYVRHEGNRTYLLVAWGEKPTGGYQVKIRDVARGTKGDVVMVELMAPDPDEVVTQAITHPSDLVSVNRLRRGITFAYKGHLTLTSPLPARRQTKNGQTGRRENGGEEPGEGGANFQVSSPTPGSTISSPLRVTGRARVFEGVFSVELEDGHRLLASRRVQVAGAPAFGSFDFSLPFDQPTNPSGALIFVTHSPKDGSRREELIVPVRFRMP